MKAKTTKPSRFQKPFDRLRASEIAAIWRISRQAVSSWCKVGGCPRNPDGTYNLADVIGWREDNIGSDDLAALVGGGGRALQAARLRLIEARAVAVETANATEAKTLLRQEVVREHMAVLAGILRGVCERLDRDFGPRAGSMFREGLDEFLREVDKIPGPTPAAAPKGGDKGTEAGADAARKS